MPDREIFAKALAERRIILTFDLDFGEIAAMSQVGSPGVVVFRLRNARGNHVIDRLGAVLATSTAALGHGAVIAVEESRHRIRHLPVGNTDDDLSQ